LGSKDPKSDRIHSQFYYPIDDAKVEGRVQNHLQGIISLMEGIEVE
jgi:hypothetical protein